MRGCNICTVSFLMIAVAGFVASLHALPQAWKETSCAGQRCTSGNGQWTAALERIHDTKLPHRDPATALWGTLSYVLFRQGREGVLIGRDGWLFTAEEFAKPPDFENEIRHKTGLIQHIRDRLAQQDIRLLIVPVPAKARLYPEHLGRYRYPSFWQGRYEAFLKTLAEEHIPAVDMHSIFQKNPGNLYWKTDTHWTPQGARLAAQSVAEEVSAQWPSLNRNKQIFSSVQTEQENHEGDLMRYIPLFSGAKEIAPEVLARIETSAAAENEDGDLFGEQFIPVALVGTSYSADARWNFAGFLKETLKADVLNAADPGQGPFATMESYLNSRAFQTTPPKLVIWEIPERYLPVHYERIKTEDQ